MVRSVKVIRLVKKFVNLCVDPKRDKTSNTTRPVGLSKTRY